MAIADKLTELQATKTAIKTAIEGKGQDLTDIPFTRYAEKITAIEGGGGGIEMTSGSFTRGGGYAFSPIAHGLTKPPKLVLCFIKDYATKTGTNICGFMYTDKVATVYRNSSTSIPDISAVAITVPNFIIPTYGAVSVDETNISVMQTAQTWTAGDYEWEAYTW
jgi:hypothetical protein